MTGGFHCNGFIAFQVVEFPHLDDTLQLSAVPTLLFLVLELQFFHLQETYHPSQPLGLFMIPGVGE